jgi:Spy/CpxP family protein refolding chaperone
LAAAALLALSIPVPVFSAMKDMSTMDYRSGHGQMMEMGHQDKMDDMMGMCIEHADKIGLSDEQIMKMKPIHREMQKKQAQFKADLKIAEIEHMEIMEVKNFDLEKATALIKKIADIRTAHQLEMLKAMKELRTILTDDQFNKMMKLKPMKTADKKTMKKMIKKQK